MSRCSSVSSKSTAQVYGPLTHDPRPAAIELLAGLLAALVVATLAADAGGDAATSWGWSSLLLPGSAGGAWAARSWLVSAGVGCALGLRRLEPLEWVFPALLAGLAGFVMLSLAWSTDVAETIHEGERMLLYLAGVSALLLLGRRSSVPWLLAAIAAGIAGVCA